MSTWWRLFGPTYVPVTNDPDGDVVVSVAGFPLGFVAYLTADEISDSPSDAAPSAATGRLGLDRGRRRSRRTPYRHRVQTSDTAV